jgi:hypothetical protein
MTKFPGARGAGNAHEVTGLTTAAEEMVAARPEVVWDLAADITRVGEWSPECIQAAWLGEPGRPKPGARFTGRNRFPNGFEYEVTCVVAEADRPRTFAWVVLDDSGDPPALPPRGGTRSIHFPGAVAGSGSASPKDPASATFGKSPRMHPTGQIRLSLFGWLACRPT